MGGLQPLVGALTFTILFNRLADVDIEGASYFAFALLGFGVWTYFSTRAGGTTSLLNNAELLTKVALPRDRRPRGRARCPGSSTSPWRRRSPSSIALVGGGGDGLSSASSSGSRSVWRCSCCRCAGPVLFLSAPS